MSDEAPLPASSGGPAPEGDATVPTVDVAPAPIAPAPPAPDTPAPDTRDDAPAARPSVAPAPEAVAPRPAPRPNYVFLAVVAIASLGLDLGTKAWAKARLDGGRTYADRHIEVIKDHVSLIFAQNKGGAWGLLQNEPETIRRPFFLGISVLAIVFIVSLYRKLTPDQWALKWGLPLVLGGALGNLVNRIQFNYVVDFIDMYQGGHHWPTYNVADVAIVVGVGLMAIDMFTPRKAAKIAVPASPPPAPEET